MSSQSIGVSAFTILIAIVLLAGPGDTAMEAHGGARNGEDFTGRLVEALGSNHFEVTQGYTKLFTDADCEGYSYPIIGSCFANNPAAPYVLPVVKSWPNEFIDPALINVFGETEPGYSVSYRLDPREAIVIFGELPPPARYMGLQTYLFTADGTHDTTSAAYRAVQARFPQLLKFLFAWSPGLEGERLQSFSSLSDSINNVVIERQSGAVWGQTRYFIITPDREMDFAIRRVLGELGVSGQYIFTESIPSADKFGEIGPLGLDRHADDFLTLMRYALPEDELAGDRWRENLPLTVLRVRESRVSPRNPQPFPAFIAESRTAVNEVQDEVLAGRLDALVGAVCDRWGDACDPASVTETVDFQQPPLSLVGPLCRTIGENCLGDTQDTSYMAVPGRFIDSGEVYALVGTLGTVTGNATYVALSVNDLQRLKGSANVSDTELAGSAAAYEPVLGDTSMLYVRYYARNCAAIAHLTDGACTQITEEMVPRGVPFTIAVRSYIRPGTQRGPDSTLQLKPRVITLTGTN